MSSKTSHLLGEIGIEAGIGFENVERAPWEVNPMGMYPNCTKANSLIVEGIYSLDFY